MKVKSVPERLILKNRQDFKISYLLSKIFIEKNYNYEEIIYSLNLNKSKNIFYENEDFEKASKIFLDTVQNKKKILIFGDYDVDGYSSTYLLYDFIINQQMKCDFFIPDRFKDGYGPNKTLLDKLIKNNDYNLIFFLDCGSNSHEELFYLEKKGIKVIVIDHHQIQLKKYNNIVIINPLKYYEKDFYIFAQHL